LQPWNLGDMVAAISRGNPRGNPVSPNRPHASKTTSNLLEILRLLPVRGRGLTPREIAEAGREQFRWEFTRRTLDRYLRQLHDDELIKVDGRERTGREGAEPQRWLAVAGRAPDARPSSEMAIAMVMLERMAKSLLPPEILEPLQTQFQAANELIRVQRHIRQGLRWPERVDFVSDSLSRVRQKVDPVILQTIQQALLRSEQIECRYATNADILANRKPRLTVREVRGLVQRGFTLYAVVTSPRHPNNPRTYRLDRFHEVNRLKGTTIEGAEAGLRDWIAAGLLDFPFSDGECRFRARIDEHEQALLLEEPLSADQVIHRERDGLYVEATVRDTRALENYVLSRISHITVLEPERLRNSVRKQLQEAMAAYEEITRRG
jgi:predicted DNA-binding transcriptional regulator YafY